MRQKTKDILIFVFAFAVIATIAYAVFLFFYVQYKYSEIPESIAMVSTPIVENDLTYNDEHEIISSVLDSIYKIDYCHPIAKFPKYIDSLEFKRIKKRSLISERERDTIKKIITISDSLVSLNIEDHKNYILKSLDTSTSEFNFVKNLKTNLNSKKIKAELIKQNGIKFLTRFSAKKEGIRLHFGKKDTVLNIGSMIFSRVTYSEKSNIGLFHFTYIGDPNCGYNSYIIFSKKGSKWIYKKTIYTGVF